MIQSLGKITVAAAGTRVRATNNLVDPTLALTVSTIRFQALHGNGSRVYVGRSDMNLTTGVGVFGVIAAPVSATQGPFPVLEFSVPSIAAALNAADFWLDVVTNGEGVFVTVLGI